ncbi:MAG TPA: hypothetical protein VF637_04325 [Sphingomicrobium sp.]|jgi:hypothetical protein
MVAPLIGAAAISAGASLVGGLTGGKGAKKAAQIQAQSAQQQIAAVERNRDVMQGLSQPTIDRGNAAGETYAGLLGVGGDAAASAKALDTWRGSTGYQDLLSAGMGAINSNAYAKGMGASGATLKALQRAGSAIASQSQGTYTSSLGALMQLGNQAVGTVGGVSTGATNAINGINQNTADANANAALASSGAWSNALQNISNIGTYAMGRTNSSSGIAALLAAGGGAGLGSSYGRTGQQGPTPTWGMPGHEQWQRNGGLDPRFG